MDHLVTQCDREGVNTYSYIPVQRIASRRCFGKLKLKFTYGFGNVAVVIPTPLSFVYSIVHLPALKHNISTFFTFCRGLIHFHLSVVAFVKLHVNHV